MPAATSALTTSSTVPDVATFAACLSGLPSGMVRHTGWGAASGSAESARVSGFAAAMVRVLSSDGLPVARRRADGRRAAVGPARAVARRVGRADVAWVEGQLGVRGHGLHVVGLPCVGGAGGGAVVDGLAAYPARGAGPAVALVELGAQPLPAGRAARVAGHGLGQSERPQHRLGHIRVVAQCDGGELFAGKHGRLLCMDTKKGPQLGSHGPGDFRSNRAA